MGKCKCCNTHEHGHSHEHHHEHEHHHHEHGEGGLRGKLLLIAATVFLLIAAVIVEHNTSLATWQLLLVYLVPYLLIGHDTLGEALEGIAKGDMFNEDFLMSVASRVMPRAGVVRASLILWTYVRMWQMWSVMKR